MNIQNSARLRALEVDHLFHLGLDSSMPLKDMFGQVKCVVMSGGRERARAFAQRLQDTFGPKNGGAPKPVGSTSRYSLFVVGQYMSVSHGMGGPSISILLVELTKLFCHAQARDVVYIRTGTCGGIGVEPGTVVISDKVYNEGLEEEMEVFECGKRRNHPAKLDTALSSALYSLRSDVPAVVGGTVSCNSYYHGQGRLDGISAGYNEADRLDFLKACHAKGVRNMEMEGLVLAGMCGQAGIPCALVCVALLDRLKGDQALAQVSQQELDSFTRRPYDIVLRFLQNALSEQTKNLEESK